MSIIVIVQLIIAILQLIAKLKSASISSPYLASEVRAHGLRALRTGNLSTLQAMKTRLEAILKKGECPECNGSGIAPETPAE